MVEGIYSKLATNIPYEILTKCYYLVDQNPLWLPLLPIGWHTRSW